MNTETITLEAPPEVAQIFWDSSSESRQQITGFISVWSSESAPEDREKAVADLKRIMKETGENAQKRGMTKEVLEDILEANQNVF